MGLHRFKIDGIPLTTFLDDRYLKPFKFYSSFLMLAPFLIFYKTTKKFKYLLKEVDCLSAEINKGVKVKLQELALQFGFCIE